MLNLSKKEKERHEGAIKLWGFVQDTASFSPAKGSLSDTKLLGFINDVATRYVSFKQEKREDVILTARFIANIEPSYLNSEGQYVELSYLRALTDLSEEEIDFICHKIEEVVKSFIVVTKETSISGGKLRIKSTLSKKKLIHAAVRHLLIGSEIFDNPEMYNELKVRSLLVENIKINYGYLVGLALSLEYNSVPKMMEDMCLKFVDQTENIMKNGTVIFYNDGIRTENL